MRDEVIERSVAPMLGLPCWMARRGFGPFVTFEFGAPRVDFGDRRPGQVAGRAVTRRSATVRGEWHLWIYGARWHVVVDGSRVAGADSEDVVIDNALGFLDGQPLTSVDLVDDRTGTTVFGFGAGRSFRVEPSRPDDIELEELWLLFQPDDSVLTVRSDGRFSTSAADDSAAWLPLPG